MPRAIKTTTADAPATATTTEEEKTITETIDPVAQHAKLAQERLLAHQEAQTELQVAEDLLATAEAAKGEVEADMANQTYEAVNKARIEFEIAESKVAAAKRRLLAAERARLNVDTRVAEAVAPYLRKALPKGIELRVQAFEPRRPAAGDELPVAYLVQTGPSRVSENGTLSNGRWEGPSGWKFDRHLSLHFHGRGRHYAPTSAEIAAAFPIEVRLHSKSMATNWDDSDNSLAVEAKVANYDREKDYRVKTFTFDVESVIPELPILGQLPDEDCLRFVADGLKDNLPPERRNSNGNSSHYSAKVRTRTEGDKITTTVEAEIGYMFGLGMAEQTQAGAQASMVERWVTAELRRWDGHGIAGLGHVANVEIKGVEPRVLFNDGSTRGSRRGTMDNTQTPQGAVVTVLVEAVAVLGDPSLPRESISHTDDQNYIEVPREERQMGNVHFAPTWHRVHKDSAEAVRWMEKEAARIDAERSTDLANSTDPEQRAKAAADAHPGRLA